MTLSYWSATRPTTAASALLPRRPQISSCPAPTSSIACSRLKLCWTHSWAPADWSARAAARRKSRRRAPLSKNRQIFVDAAMELPRPPFRLHAVADITRGTLEASENAQMARSCPHHRSRRHDRLRLDRQRHAAADRTPCLLYTSPSPRDRQKSRM